MTKHLILHAGVCWLYVDKHSRFNVIFGLVGFATNSNICTFKKVPDTAMEK